MAEKKKNLAVVGCAVVAVGLFGLGVLGLGGGAVALGLGAYVMGAAEPPPLVAQPGGIAAGELDSDEGVAAVDTDAAEDDGQGEAAAEGAVADDAPADAEPTEAAGETDAEPEEEAPASEAATPAATGSSSSTSASSGSTSSRTSRTRTTSSSSSRSRTSSSSSRSRSSGSSNGYDLLEEGGEIEQPSSGSAGVDDDGGSVDSSHNVQHVGDGSVFLYKSGSRYVLPAEVPPGKYDIHVSFGEEAPVKVGSIRVKSGQNHRIRCSERMGICREE